MQVLKTTTRCDLKLSCDLTFNCGKIFVERCPWEFIFEEKDLFEISKNKNPSKIMRYTVIPMCYFIYRVCLMHLYDT